MKKNVLIISVVKMCDLVCISNGAMWDTRVETPPLVWRTHGEPNRGTLDTKAFLLFN